MNMVAGMGQADDPEGFLQSIQETVASLREQTKALLDSVNELHQTSTESRHATSTPEVLKGYQTVANQTTLLRTRNRHLAHLVRQTKTTTAVSRSEIDRLHLGLQNLYYEQRHLEGEITGCEEYPHPYAQLPLIGDNRFFEKYPEWLERRMLEGDENGERGFMIARIDEEKHQREALEAVRLELVKRKTELTSQNAKKKDDLANLDKQLEAFVEVGNLHSSCIAFAYALQATRPIQKTLEKYGPIT